MSDSNNEDEAKKLPVVKTAADLQRMKLMRLMKNPEKPAYIPEAPKPKTLAAAPELVRNVMGSGAGAGSGEFHLYRNLRRKEMNRQKQMDHERRKEILDEEFRLKREEAKRQSEEATAKKRAKRLKKKQKFKLKKQSKTDGNQSKNNTKQEDKSESENESSDEEKPVVVENKNNE